MHISFHQGLSLNLCRQVAITLKQQICKSHTIFSPALGNPSCLQTTRAPMLSQKSSHTVPQALLKHTSTRPSSSVSPPTSLTVPLVQEVWGGSEGRVRNCGQLDSEGLALNPGFSIPDCLFGKKSSSKAARQNPEWNSDPGGLATPLKAEPDYEISTSACNAVHGVRNLLYIATHACTRNCFAV